MPVSGILVVCRPDHLPDVRDSIDAQPWAEVHHTAPDGRLVVTIESDTTDQAMDRLLDLKKLPNIAMAEMAEHYVGDEEFEAPATNNPLQGREIDSSFTDTTADSARNENTPRREIR